MRNVSIFSFTPWIILLVLHAGLITCQDAVAAAAKCVKLCTAKSTNYCCRDYSTNKTLQAQQNSSCGVTINCNNDFEPDAWMVNLVEPAPSATPTPIYQYGGDTVVDDRAQNFLLYARNQNYYMLKKALDGIRPGKDSSGSIRVFESSAYIFSLKDVSEDEVKALSKVLPTGVVITPKTIQATFARTGGEVRGASRSNDAMGRYINPQQLGLRNLGGASVRDWDGTEYAAFPGVDIQTTDGWSVESRTGTSLGRPQVVVAVIDDGFNFTDAQYLGNLYKNGGEAGDKSCNGKDDDFNGFIDDYQGWDSVLRHGCVRDGALKENIESGVRRGHGTHVASILAAGIPTDGSEADVAKSAIGVAPNVSLLPIRAYREDIGGYDSASLVEAYRYLLALKGKGVNVVVVNTSFSAPCADIGDVERKAIEGLVNAGITVVGAAGNSGTSNDISPMCPGNLGADARNPGGVKGVLSIANAAPGGVRTGQSVAALSKLHPFSNFGATFVNTAAPGTVIYANGEFRSGTSMATPHVSGVVALMYSVNPFITPAEVEGILSSSQGAKQSPSYPVRSGSIVAAGKALKAASQGVIAGTVYFDGKPISKAVVSMKAGGFLVKSLTDSSGNFFFKRAPIGTPVEVSVIKDGIFFSTQTSTNAVLNDPPRFEFKGESSDRTRTGKVSER